MKSVLRRWLLALPILLVAAVPALYWAVGAWLETAGGRAAVERALGERLGLPVHLLGDFQVMLWPDIGVSGTRLVIGEPGAATEVARGDEFAVAVALRPLIRRELRIDSFGLSGGAVYPDRFERSAPEDAVGTPGGFRLPDITSFSVRDLEIGLGEGDSPPVRVRRFEFHGFAAGAQTPFDLAVEGFGAFDGRFRWNPTLGQVYLSGTWSGLLPDRVQIDFDATFDPLLGHLSARSLAPAGPALSLAWRQHAGGWTFTGLDLAAGGQSLTGQGCYYTGPKPSLHIDLAAKALDVAALTGAMPSFEGGQQGGSVPPFELRARIRATQVEVGGGSARKAELTWGGVPDCSAFEESSAAPSPGGGATSPGKPEVYPLAVPAPR
ncbi:MAG: hypothetical protein PVJ33_09355 [Lysobacterales bacterium]|jgi:hypothetical protein